MVEQRFLLLPKLECIFWRQGEVSGVDHPEKCVRISARSVTRVKIVMFVGVRYKQVRVQ